MAGIGFALLLVNALSYIFGWDIGNPALTIFGLISVLNGLKIARRP